MHTRWALCSRHRWPTRIVLLRENARLPDTTSFADLDGHLSPARRKDLRRLIDDRLLERGENAFLSGGEEVLRADAVTAIGNALVDAGHPLLFARATELGRSLCDRQQHGRLATELRNLDRLDLIILLDLHRVDPGSEEEGLIVRLLERRRDIRSVLAIAEQSLDRQPTEGSAPLSSPGLGRFFDRARCFSLDP